MSPNSRPNFFPDLPSSGPGTRAGDATPPVSAGEMPEIRRGPWPRWRRWARRIGLLGWLAGGGLAAHAQDTLPERARGALTQAAGFFHDRVASHGGYAYYYSEDLRERWGEGAGTADQIWVQPPGTPAVGRAFLRAYQATGDVRWREAARDAGLALAYGQLKSGGWTQTIDFDPQGSRVALYRNGRGQGRNHTSLDDNQTQSAIAFLATLDEALGFQDAAIHAAAGVALEALLAAQFPNGAFPQGFTGPVAAHPVVSASFPDEWPRTWPNEHYWDYYTLNDGLAGTVTDALLVAHAVYRDDRYRRAIARLGDFLVRAQMPEPQPAWAQQYNFAMQPVWARKFEPPAICGLESEDAIRTLLKIRRLTGDPRYLAPIPRALAYLKSCRLPDGRMARYYELRTNRPLYMNRRDGTYFLTYDDANLPAHYGWKQPTAVDALAAEFQELQAGRGETIAKPDLAVLADRARAIIAELDPEGRWISVHAGERLVGQPKFAVGFRYLSCEVFIRNLDALSDYVRATRSSP